MDKKERIVFLDWLRVAACFMVILTHCTEPFYLGGEGTMIASAADAWWCTIINSLVRSCVPLFVMVSSYLLFPLKQPAGEFFKRRAVRVLVPLLIWVVVYALANPDAAGNLKRVIFNFPDPAGHLWFVYMLIGVYILMPLLSPWAEKASRKELQVFLGIWAFTTIIPFIRQASLAVSGTAEIWGEANWNEFGSLYYVSGFIGYLVLGYYLRREVPELSWKKTLSVALPAFAAGAAVTMAWYRASIPSEFPVNEPISLAVTMETSWRFCSLGPALMTLGLFLLARKIKCSGAFYKKLILPVSQASYGVYLMHILVLNLVHGWLRPICEAAFGPVWATPACIFASAILTFSSCALIAVFARKIPAVGKIIFG